MRMPIKRQKSIKEVRHLRRKLSIRKKLSGTTERPRLCIVKSNKHLSAQVIDDTKGHTLVAISTFGKKSSDELSKTKDGTKVFGKLLAEKIKAKGITQVVFDRNGFSYTGLIALVADSVRENGVQI
jgi:large subunit ribosomal protein L18